MPRQQVCNYVTSSKTSFQGFRLYQDSPFTAFIGIVPHDYCFLEVVTKLNVNQNIFGRLYPVFFHSLCQSSFVKANLPKFGYWMRYRHNNRLKMVQLLKSVDLQDQIISWDSRRRMGHTLDGLPPIAKGIITNWIVRRFGKSLTTTLEWKMVRTSLLCRERNGYRLRTVTNNGCPKNITEVFKYFQVRTVAL